MVWIGWVSELAAIGASSSEPIIHRCATIKTYSFYSQPADAACGSSAAVSKRWLSRVARAGREGASRLGFLDRALGCEFFRHDCEAHQGVGAERQGQGNVGGVPTARDQNPADPRVIVARVKGVPPPPSKT